jgi:thymidylate synthase
MNYDRIVPFNYLSGRDTFHRIRAHTWNLFLAQSHRVHTEKWQGVDIGDKPEMVSYELMNYTFTHDLRGEVDLQHWRHDVQPNLPWADDHFEERVCGKPINPGVEWANWPWGGNAAKFLDEQGQFNHNYMERYWPKYAGTSGPTRDAEHFDLRFHLYSWRGVTPHRGIRNEYGDLNDLVQSLARNPLSRQEWFPIFHPEDVGEVVGGRKPCSLGYQFWVRGQRLHVYYPLRSCDFFRHMQDDIYLTIRLLIWVLNRCREIDEAWFDVHPGTFTMHCTSLHVFANDMVQMKKEGPRT